MKKNISLTMAAIGTATAIVCGSTSAYSVDLQSLSDALLGKEILTDEMDIDSNGTIDVFDLVRLRQKYTVKGDTVVSEVDLTEKNVKYMGRNLYEDGTAWLIQSGSAVEFTVNGSSAEITINGDGSEENEEKYRPRYAVIVDDEIILDEVLGVSEKKITLFEGNESRSVKVKVIHLSEANNGAVGVSNLKVTSDFAVPVVPAPKKDLSIEFIGDSITCAYGVEASSNSDSFSTSTENFMYSYAYLTAQKLNADYSAVSYSGHGIISGYTSDGKKNSDSLVPPFYPNYGAYGKYAIPWDYEKNKSDVIVINLGTNDASFIDKDFDERKQEYVDGYISFLEEVRRYNPDAHIICTLGIMGCQDEYPLIEQAIAEYTKSSGDTKVTSYMSPVQSQADGYGADWHPSKTTQQKNAYLLSDKICQVLGIESDQIGLDVAADAEYRLDINEDDASASIFISDYDKSFWINMVNGGDSPDDIEAVISGIDLKKGGKYKLTMKITTEKGQELPIIIRSKDKSKVYFEDTFVSDGEKTPFEAEFTSEFTDNLSDLVVQVGGKNYYSVTLYEIRVEKTG